MRTATLASNPYAPPSASVDDAPSTAAAPPLWNPGAAVNWSLLLTPAFGAFLHMRNWQALGELERATESRRWMIGIIVLTPLLIVAAALLPESRWLSTTVRGASIGLLVAWYYGSGRRQLHYVREHFGRDYPRRAWTRPLLSALAIGIAAFGVLLVTVFVIAYAVARLSMA